MVVAKPFPRDAIDHKDMKEHPFIKD